MSDRGRKGRILLYGYGLEVERLRNDGLSYNDIAKIINEEHPENLPINKDTIGRFYNRLDHKESDSTPIELIELLKDLFEDIKYELRRTNMSKNDRIALLRLVSYKENKLKARILASSNISSGFSSETKRIDNILIRFSKCLCDTCREKVVSVLDK